MRVGMNFIVNYAKLRWLRYVVKKDNPERKLIVINLLEHLGDIVACEPIVRHLRQANPDAYLVWAVKKAYRELIVSNPHIDRALVMHCLSERISLVKRRLFDEVIDLHFHERYCSLCRKPLRKMKNGVTIGLGNYFNFGGILAALAQSVGLQPLDEPPRVYIPIAARQRVNCLSLPRGFIVISCSSNNAEKNWPAAKWLELVERMTDSYNLAVVEVGIVPLLGDNHSPRYINLCGKLSILESAEVIRRASLFVGIDSGPAHLANAVGTYGIILMGSYLGFERYMPFSGPYRTGEMAEIINHKGPVADISVKKVVEAVSDYFTHQAPSR